jgi:hypothetical protein
VNAEGERKGGGASISYQCLSAVREMGQLSQGSNTDILF